MVDQSQEPIFFHEGHRAFLETPSADFLSFDALRRHLYWLMTKHRYESYGESCGAMVIYGTVGILGGGVGIAFLVVLGFEAIAYMVAHGFPHWRLIVYALIMWGWLAVATACGVYICLDMLKEAIILRRWPDRRIADLLAQIARDGALIQGYLEPIEIQHQMQLIIPYRFTKPSGEESRGEFRPNPYPSLEYLDVKKEFTPGRPVWVLYLNDKTSVLL